MKSSSLNVVQAPAKPRCSALFPVLFCVVQLSIGAAWADSQRTLFYSSIGAGASESLLFRTVFHFMNEGTGEVSAKLKFFPAGASVGNFQISSSWAGAQGSVVLMGSQVEFSIPDGSSLELALVPPSPAWVGWARLTFSGDPVARAVLQVGTLPEGLAAPFFPQFEHYIEQEAEVFPSGGLKTFSFPIFLFLGSKNVNTAFSIVNLSAAPGTVRLTLRPGLVKTVQLQPGQLLADYFDRFWGIAVLAIFPFRLLTTAEVSSDVPLGVTVMRTVEKLPLSGVQVISTLAAADSVTASLNTEFELAINQTGRVQSEGLEVTFWNVSEDSRCPIDVTCIQAGRAGITVRVSENGQSQGEFALSTSQEENAITVGQYSIRLVRVRPAPVSTQTINISSYRATLVISRK